MVPHSASSSLVGSPSYESGDNLDRAAVLAYSHDILLVDDDEALREMLSQVLRAAGYTLHGVAHGRAALEYLAATQARLVVTDVFMPEADGLELLNRLRTMPRPPPIIAMSGSVDGSLQVMLRVARHLGAKETLNKPFPLQELLKAVRRTIGLPRAETSGAEGASPVCGKSTTGV